MAVTHTKQLTLFGKECKGEEMDACSMCGLIVSDGEERDIDGVQQMYALGTQILSSSALLSCRNC